jgi:NAD(P)-dependent dehydrogenase (short-subunit alcohol dehydrogenase family)
MDMKLDGTRVLVSGGASGIGLACAAAFLQQGARVGVISRSDGTINNALGGALAGHDGQLFTAVADVRDETAVSGAVAALAEQLGGIDHVVTSAGVEGEMGAKLEEVTGPGFRNVLDVNVLGTFLVVKHATPYLKQGPQSSVAIIGSDSGFVAAPGMLAYNASKGAIVQLTRALSFEMYEDLGIRVNSVCPSITDTPMARRGMEVDSFDDVPFPVNAPEDIAWAVLFLCSPLSRAINGVSLLSDFGYSSRSSFPA